MRYFLLFTTQLIISTTLVFGQDYLQGKLFAKFNYEEDAKMAFSTLDKVYNELKISNLSSVAPFIPSEKLKTSSPKTDLSRLFTITYTSNIDAKEACEMLMATGAFEYVEPHYIHPILHIPNDPYADSTLPAADRQDQLIKHKAYEAWDIEKGDTNVVIGIVDAGFLSTHEDLVTQIKYNPQDTLGNGINDDNDFFYYDGNFYPLVDNYAGWDIADFDPDVSSTVPHGTLVAGCSSGAPNNGLGVAGTGYNCKFLPIKASLDAAPSSISYGYFGLLYAAQKGCQVINLSWGSPNSYSQAVQDIINYAALEADATLVAAAGNVPTEYSDYYPACYDNVLSVTATRIGNAMYGKVSYFVDMNALGRNVRTLNGTANDAYVIQHGTSYSAPIVSGAIALVRSQRPHLTGMQAAEQVRVTGDIVDTISYTVQYKELMGRSLNMFRALTDSTLPSVRIVGKSYASETGTLTFSGDSIEITLDFINYLTATTATEVDISVVNSGATMGQNTANLGTIATLDSAHQKFTFYLEPGASVGDSIIFRAGFKDGAYEDYQYFVWIVEGNTAVITTVESTIEEEDKDISLYPNPFSEELFLVLQNHSEASITYSIEDMESKKLYESTLEMSDSRIQLPIPYIPAGLYILTFKVGQDVYHKKVVKL